MTEQTHSDQPEQDRVFVDEVTAMIGRIKQGLQLHGNDIDLVGIDRNHGIRLTDIT